VGVPGAASADRGAASSAYRPCLPSQFLLNSNKDLPRLTETRYEGGRRRAHTDESTARARVCKPVEAD
jgi:hypothetical protein